MNTIDRAHNEGRPAVAAPPLARGIGRHGLGVVLFAVTGGILLGGVLPAIRIAQGALSAHALFLTSTGLYLFGALLGLVHAVPLMYFGRRKEVSSSQAGKEMLLSGLYMIPALAVGWLASIWTAMTYVSLVSGRVGPVIGSALGWFAAGMILASTTVVTVRAVSSAWARWPERWWALSSGLLAASGLAATLIAERPVLWGIRLRTTEEGAILLALLLSVWFVGPAVTAVLRVWKRVMTPVSHGVGGRLQAVTLTALTGGLAAASAYALSTGSVAVSGGYSSSSGFIGQAVFDALVLRTGLLVMLMAALTRWKRVTSAEAAVVAVVMAGLLEGLVRTPAIMQIGYASAWLGTLHIVGLVVVPALAFNALMIRRGMVSGAAASVLAASLTTLVW